MEGLFKLVGIYSHAGQLYEPVDSNNVMYYKECTDGQIFEEGITEAGSMSSFVAAGTAYSAHGINMIPFFVYYLMFGFQRIGDLIWAAADCRAKGFLIGGTAVGTTLNGEGLQASRWPQLADAIAFHGPLVDPAYAYEITVIIFDGMRRMYEEGEDAMYYLTVENENYVQPAMPEGAEEGILKGIYKLWSEDAGAKRPHVHLFGSGAILRETLHAQTILAEKYEVSSTVWSVTSYTELHRDAAAVERWNMLHPAETPARVISKAWLPRVPFGRSPPRIMCVPWPNKSARGFPAGCTCWAPTVWAAAKPRDLHRRFEVDAETVPWPACIAWPRKNSGPRPTWPRPLPTWASTRRRSTR